MGDLVRLPWTTVATVHYLDDYRASQWLSAERLHAVRLAALRRLVWHCFLNVPFHAAAIARTLGARRIERIASPEELPVSRAAVRRADPAAFRSRGGEPTAAVGYTAGGRGVPQPVFATAEAMARRAAVRQRCEEWSGLRFDPGAPPFSWYTAAEVGVIAAPCAGARGVHLLADHLLVEIVDELGRAVPVGEIGGVLVTDLHNYAAPYLRHELGDRGRLLDRACPCGRALPLFELARRAWVEERR
jgi:phenylacetate-coenzyme A ligase PaaK-like adenylate-forming protein